MTYLEEQGSAVPGLQELRKAVNEYYFCDSFPYPDSAELRKLYALAEENQRAAAYIYAQEYGRSFGHQAGENAMAAIAKGEDISDTLSRMRDEGGTGSRMTCLMFGELFEMRP